MTLTLSALDGLCLRVASPCNGREFVETLLGLFYVLMRVGQC